MDNKKIIDFLKNHKKDFRERFNIKTLGVFGSFARNEAQDASDIDLIVEFDDNTSNIFEKKQEIKALLGNEFNREIDICNLRYIKPFLKDHILNQALYV